MSFWRFDKFGDLAVIMKREELDKLAKQIIGIAIEIHKILGPGFVEKIYAKALAYELSKNKMRFSKEKVIRVKYKDLLLGDQRVDFLIEDSLILELKAVSAINDIHLAQILSYLKAADKRLGLILNFARGTLEIKRVANKF
ncbi:GxxExxY protein [Candidatus Margulisiibacteriota bacterium]